MNFALILSLFLIVLYIGYGALITDWKKELKEILGYSVLTSLLIIWGTYFLMFSGIYSKMENFIYILFLVISFLISYKIYSLSKTKPLEVVARQQSYWKISQEAIFKKFNYKLDIKKDRIEIKTNELAKKIYRKYSNKSEMITGNIFLSIENLKLTKIENLNDIESKLYKEIFSKIKELIIIQEIEVDFHRLLKDNDYYLEYFLINCWELHTKRINIGIAPLNVIADNFTEQELLGALDNVCMSSIKRNGAALYYKYMEFKDLLPKIEDEKEKDELKEDDYF